LKIPKRRQNASEETSKLVHLRIDSKIDYDVIVAGGGPAGASAAFYLSRAGLKVALIDKCIFPRDKVCGDFVGPLALVELNKLGITEKPEYKKSNIIRFANVHLNGKSIISRAIPRVKDLPSYGRAIPRRVLDNLLFNAAEEAGAAGWQGYTVTGFKNTPDFVEVSLMKQNRETHVRAKLLIGADGSNSIVSQQIRGKTDTAHRIISVRAYFQDVEGPEDEANLFFSEDSFPGYFWLFPTGNGTANVGIGMLRDTMPSYRDSLSGLLRLLIEKDAALHKRMKSAKLSGKILGWPLATYDPKLPLVSDRVLLAGDAAGLINPLNGEGIQYALLSGRIAAEFAIQQIETRLSKSILEGYSARIEHELRYDMALSNVIVQLIRNRTLNPVWLRALRIIVSRASIDFDYAEKVGGILSGLVPAHDALSFKVISGTLEQAAVSLGIDVAWTALRGPKHLTDAAATKAAQGMALVNEAINHPVDVAGWGIKTSLNALELASQAAKSYFTR